MLWRVKLPVREADKVNPFLLKDSHLCLAARGQITVGFLTTAEGKSTPSIRPCLFQKFRGDWRSTD